jgi:hypothetical protein
VPNKNFRSGTAFEARFIARLLDEKKAIKAGRFYASKGITDVWWVSPQGVHNEAQLKFSKNNPYIHPNELKKLQEFANKVTGAIGVWLVTKQSRKPIQMRCLN